MTIFSFGSSTLIGLDAQSGCLRLARVKKYRQTFQLEQATARPLPTKVLVDGKLERFDLLGPIVEEMVQALNLRRFPAAISLSANQVRIQQIQLPADLSEAEIEAEIQIHIQRELPGIQDPLCIDFNVLPSTAKQTVNVSFAAVREAYLTNYTACVNAAGLVVKMVDVDIAARQRVLRLYPDVEGWLKQADIDDASFLENPAAFMTACGLAMREVPKW